MWLRRRRLFAWFYHHLRALSGDPDPQGPFIRDILAPLLARARGDVLEVGAGDGGNLPHYPSGVSLTLLDVNAYMLGYLPEAGDGRRPAVQGAGEALPFPSAHFDTVVATHVLCSVRDQARTLGEVRRVLRPGGRFLFLEHVAAPPGTGTARAQQVINPVWRALGDGCHLTRDTGAAIEAAGFRSVALERLTLDGLWIVGPHVVGVAEA